MKFAFWPISDTDMKPLPLWKNTTLLYPHLKIIWALRGSSGWVIWSVRCRFGGFPLSQLITGAALTPLPVFSAVRWSMAARAVTYPDNMSGRRTRPLRDLIWQASSLDIERALFGDASSFLLVRDIHIPKFPPSCVSALCRPGDPPTPRAVPLD